MGQSWLVVNLDNIRRLETGLKLGEGFVSMGSDLERYLLPRQLFEKMDPARLSVAMGSLVPRDSLLRLPNELLTKIAECLYNVHHIFFFGATHTRIWKCALPSLNQWAIRQCWGGHQLAVLGHYMEMDDFPSGVLSDDEFAAIARIPSEGSHSGTLYNAAYDYPAAVGDPDRLNEVLDPFRRPWEIKFPKPIVQVRDALRARGTYSRTSLRPGPRDRARDAYRPLEGRDQKGGHTRGGQGHTQAGPCLMFRISCSSDSSCSMYDPREDLTRGPWTGDRFDIVLEEEFENADGDWEDVSDDICERFQEIRKEYWGRPPYKRGWVYRSSCVPSCEPKPNRRPY